ncbi:LysE family translocator [Thiomonas intermedia]|uniref:LysE family translocator n=1 Tax=Thiomonas intermedia TaxID=926 RepID=UPI0009A531EB|nr:LysE family translocator [Thiomonas intermedia]
MSDIHHFALFLLSGLLLNMTPGADMLFIVSRSAGQGAKAGVMAALGVGAGCLVHVTGAAVGLSALIAASDLAFSVVKWLGAFYLVWLGIGLLRAKTSALGPQGTQAIAAPLSAAPLRAVFWQGVLTNVLNPKIVLFFLAFLPQFVGPSTHGQGWAFLLLGVVFTVNGTLFNLGVAWVAARARHRMGRMQRLALWVRRLTGVVFVGLGLRLALASRV